jgi:hypothetical protein
MKKLGKRAGEELSDTEKVLIQLHASEYSAMVTRISRFMSLQFVIWPVLIGVLIFIAKEYSKRQLPADLTAWGSVFAIQFATQNYNFALYEVYNHVRYIERVLRPRVVALLGTDAVWEYERYLHKTGKAHSAWIGDIGPAIGSLVAILLSAYWRWDDWRVSDFWGFALNGILLVQVSLTAYRIVMVRKAPRPAPAKPSGRYPF